MSDADLPLGTSNFRALRMEGQIYVDKTPLIHELASKRRKFFLSRPRRFGKSLLVSTFKSLFKDGLRDFKGLAIENLWKDEGRYRVLALDFSSLKAFPSSEAFSAMFDQYFADLMAREGLEPPAGMKATGLRAFTNWLAVQPENSTVILIDEYDAPLTAALNNPELFELVRMRLSAFYAEIKNWDGAIRFLFITGITKFSKTSIFSELNNVKDISLYPKYGTLLGYTREEITRYFQGYLDRASQVLGIENEELMKELEYHYDGFCFDRAASTRVFAPWSLLNFLDDPQNGLLDYWFESGGKPSALLQYLKSHALRDPENYANQKSIALNALSSSSNIETLTDIGLLTQAGYLTIKRVVGTTAYLDYPNAEVRTAMAQLYTEELLKGKTVEQAGAEGAAVRLTQASPEEIVELFNRFFQSLDYQNYPVRDEASVRAFAQAFLAGSGLDPRAEVHNSKGRSDLEVRAGSRLWVFEFKVQRRNDHAELLLRDALEQIQSRNYGEESSAREYLRVALVFSLEKRKFVQWAQCPLL